MTAPDFAKRHRDRHHDRLPPPEPRTRARTTITKNAVAVGPALAAMHTTGRPARFVAGSPQGLAFFQVEGSG